MYQVSVCTCHYVYYPVLKFTGVGAAGQMLVTKLGTSGAVVLNLVHDTLYYTYLARWAKRTSAE